MSHNRFGIDLSQQLLDESFDGDEPMAISDNNEDTLTLRHPSSLDTTHSASALPPAEYKIRPAAASASPSLTDVYRGLSHLAYFDRNVFKGILKQLPDETLLSSPESAYTIEDTCPISTFNFFTGPARATREYISNQPRENELLCSIFSAESCGDRMALSAMKYMLLLPACTLAPISVATHAVTHPTAVVASGLGLFACSIKKACRDREVIETRQLVSEELVTRGYVKQPKPQVMF
jgi:hypothetical protein